MVHQESLTAKRLQFSGEKLSNSSICSVTAEVRAVEVVGKEVLGPWTIKVTEFQKEISLKAGLMEGRSMGRVWRQFWQVGFKKGGGLWKGGRGKTRDSWAKSQKFPSQPKPSW